LAILAASSMALQSSGLSPTALLRRTPASSVTVRKKRPDRQRSVVFHGGGHSHAHHDHEHEARAETLLTSCCITQPHPSARSLNLLKLQANLIRIFFKLHVVHFSQPLVHLANSTYVVSACAAVWAFLGRRRRPQPRRRGACNHGGRRHLARAAAATAARLLSSRRRLRIRVRCSGSYCFFFLMREKTGGRNHCAQGACFDPPTARGL
jgi:hypothetical protein